MSSEERQRILREQGARPAKAEVSQDAEEAKGTLEQRPEPGDEDPGRTPMTEHDADTPRPRR